MNEETITILYIEDNPDDAVLMEEMLAEQNLIACSLARVSYLATGLERLGGGGADVVLLDLLLPDSHGLETFKAVKNLTKDLPIIIMTGLADETLAITCVQEGAQDYLVKGHVDAGGIARAIRYAIERAKLVHQLRDALEQVKTLRGFIPICANCKKIRDDQGYWKQIEVFIRDHTEADFTHSVCPECLEKLYPQYKNKIGNASTPAACCKKPPEKHDG